MEIFYSSSCPFRYLIIYQLIKKQDNCINYVIYYKKMEIADRIDRIQSNPVYPVNPVKRFD
ncbi:MAG: hypothetical protein C5S44_09925 [Candidatus Methanocomedens sp.]|nr:MAG: hypothetical protein C5S44_09925 [ANME-2 cluster archaeon]